MTTHTIYAIKDHMEQSFVKNKRIPVTVLRLPKHELIGLRLQEKDGYNAVILGIGQSKDKSFKWIREVRLVQTNLDDLKQAQLPQSINLEEILKPQVKIQAAAASKGKGFAGVIKRWGFSGLPRTHGTKHKGRAPGSIGRGTTPGRVLPGKKMPGRLGGGQIAVKNLKIIDFNPQEMTMSVSGPTPGSRNTLTQIKILS